MAQLMDSISINCEQWGQWTRIIVYLLGMGLSWGLEPMGFQGDLGDAIGVLRELEMGHALVLLERDVILEGLAGLDPGSDVLLKGHIRVGVLFDP